MDEGVFFVIHVWRDTQGFHASARDVTREDAEAFDDAFALARFLVARTCTTRADEPGGFGEKRAAEES